MNNKILAILLLTISCIIIKSNGLEFIQAMYDNNECKNTPLTMQISSACAYGIYVKPIGDGTTTSNRVNVGYGIHSASDCLTSQTNQEDLNTCSSSSNTQLFLNQNSNVSTPNGFCSELVQFSKDDCENILLNSYRDGVCVGPDSKGFYQRFLCSGTTVKRYNCSSNCQKSDGISSCILDKELNSISSCPSIGSKDISDIIKIDGKVDVTGGSTTTTTPGTDSGATTGSTTGNSSRLLINYFSLTLFVIISFIF